MKFEKFLKGCGTHGQVLEMSNGDTWLICAGVGMKVPVGVTNLLGSGEVGEKTKKIVEALVKADTDDKVFLKRAVVEKGGKSRDIIQIFGDINDIEVGIYNDNFGLLEKSDYNLAEVEIEADDFRTETKYLLILTPGDEVIGFIQGVKDI